VLAGFSRLTMTYELGSHLLAVLARPSCLAALSGLPGHHLRTRPNHLRAVLAHLVTHASGRWTQPDYRTDGYESDDRPPTA
jgi:hypothetical protein